jgi:hypothetical protein
MQSNIRAFIGRRRAERRRLSSLSTNLMRATREQNVIANELVKFAGEVIDWTGENDVPNVVNQMRQLDLLTRQILHRKLTTSRISVSPENGKQVPQDPPLADGLLGPQKEDGFHMSLPASLVEAAGTRLRFSRKYVDPATKPLNRMQLYVFAVLSAFANRPDGVMDSTALQAAAKYLVPVKKHVSFSSVAESRFVRNSTPDTELAQVIMSEAAAKQRAKLEHKREQLEQSRIRYATKIGVSLDQLLHVQHNHIHHPHQDVKSPVSDIPAPYQRSEIPVIPEATDKTSNFSAEVTLTTISKVLKPAAVRIAKAVHSYSLRALNNLASLPLRSRLLVEPTSTAPLQPLSTEGSPLHHDAGSLLSRLSPIHSSGHRIGGHHVYVEDTLDLRILDSHQRTYRAHNNRRRRHYQDLDASKNKQLSLETGLTRGLEREVKDSARSSDRSHDHKNVIAETRSRHPSTHMKLSVERHESNKVQEQTGPDQYWAELLQHRQYAVIDLVRSDVFLPVSQSAALTTLIRGQLPPDLLLHAIIVRRWTKSLYSTCISKILEERSKTMERPHRACSRCLKPIFLAREFADHCGTDILRLQMEQAVTAGVRAKGRCILDRGASHYECKNGGSLNWVNLKSLESSRAFLNRVCRFIDNHAALKAFNKSGPLPLAEGLIPVSVRVTGTETGQLWPTVGAQNPVEVVADIGKSKSPTAKNDKSRSSSPNGEKIHRKDKGKAGTEVSETPEDDKHNSKNRKAEISKSAEPDNVDGSGPVPPAKSPPSSKSKSPPKHASEKVNPHSGVEVDEPHLQESKGVDINAEFALPAVVSTTAVVSIETTSILSKEIDFQSEQLADYLISPMPLIKYSTAEEAVPIMETAPETDAAEENKPVKPVSAKVNAKNDKDKQKTKNAGKTASKPDKKDGKTVSGDKELKEPKVAGSSPKMKKKK